MSKTYVNVLVYDKGPLGIKPTVRDSLHIFYRRGLYIDKLPDNPEANIIDTSEDSCIEKADYLNYDFAILTWEGNIFDIHIYHDQCIDYINELDEKTQGNWLVAGHIMDQYQNRILHEDLNADQWQNSFWLFPITAVINLKKWKELGRPSWGQEDGIKTVQKIIASEDCVHDNYTPRIITPGDTTVEARVKKGWNIINASMKANLPVYNLNKNIRNAQTYLYPENNVDLYNTFWQTLYDMPKLNDQYLHLLKQLLPSKSESRIDHSTWQCFIKNTENYFPKDPEAQPVDWEFPDTFILPCSGFKDLIVSLGNHRTRKSGKYIHFDIISHCVDIKRMIIQKWDGGRANFGIILSEINDHYLKTMEKDCFHCNDMKEFSDAYEDIIPFFNSEQDLQDCWHQFRNCKHEYVFADLLEEPHKIMKYVNNTDKVYLCLSDIAGWRNNIMSYGYQNLRQDLINAIKEFTRRNISGYVDYKDPGSDIQKWQLFSEAITYLETPIHEQTI